MALFSIADNFIRRPVLTTVCTLLIVLAGAVAIPLLPIEQLPEIAPLQIQVTANYTGADAETVESSVTTVLEREVNGVEGMEFITSSSTNTGQSSINVVFQPGRDKDIAQVDVQNRVARAEPQLPPEVTQLGVTVNAQSPSILLVYRFFTDDNRYDALFLSNYADLFILDEMKQLNGVGNAEVFGAGRYAMRLWLDPAALAKQELTPGDVVAALREQNVQVGGGAVGAPPTDSTQAFQYTVRLPGRLQEVSEFENLVIKVGAEGDLVRLSEIGRAELGAQDYSFDAQTQGKLAAGLLVYQLPGSNALEVAQAVRDRMAELEQNFPPGYRAELVFDTTDFVQVSLREVLSTLVLAIVLVLAILFLFLQDWRSTVVPAIAIPVSLIGAMAFLLAFGFSINTLTLFGCILASGLVVDDAIVIVEAIAAKIDQGMRPKLAALDAMQELSGAVISTSLVLMAVFIPVAFFPGSTGKIYQQFALTIAFTVLVSTFNALTFSPAMSALLLRPVTPGTRGGPLAGFFNRFNALLAWVIERYRRAVRILIRLRYGVLALFAVGLLLLVGMFRVVPTGFVPEEDQGYFLGIVQAPDGVSLEYTKQVMDQADQLLSQFPEIESTFMLSGFSFDGPSPSRGVFFATLAPWDQRRSPESTVTGLLPQVNGALSSIQEALVIAFNAPPVPGFSPTGALEMQLQDRSGNQMSIDQFLGNAYEIIGLANQSPASMGVFTQFTASSPQVQVDIDRDRIKALDIDINEALTTVGTYLGSSYVNDFTSGGRNYRVYVQAEAPFRNEPSDINAFYVRSRQGVMVPLGEVVTLKEVVGPATINHFNLLRSIKLEGMPAPTASSGQLIAAMTEAHAQAALPVVGMDWQGTAREEIASGGLSTLIFGLGVLVVFLVLAAQYENYTDPIIILLTVPLAVLGALVFLFLRGLDLNIYAQVGLVMLIGLASKNAILIVEFANQARSQGLGLVPSAIAAAEQRFRPIIMTAISSLVGFFPLLIATGAGSASRWSVGYTVFGGLLVATVLSLLVVPVLYVVLKGLTERILPGGPGSPPTVTTSTDLGNGSNTRQEDEAVAAWPSQSETSL
ncbi:efflux RND transporter permease subunit [Nodosilinea sp. LEGE 07088]|uniref:efflux RND transporter permease subunit n=1 Tax=Nodosilinea sp. LEGE 07088 TaxID=2777968 RepID=UPI001881DA09|nr:efflux RND transporter permease subunit [Nodosilinea sp. LEGE 07088]MBE9136738.1 efflux RND transporter permease subunit [Nodosilinea sp. LEGE 07088]